MERYSEYKDSGVKWLGEIPSHWEVMPLKSFIKFEKGKTPKEFSDENIGLPYLTMDYLRSRDNKIVKYPTTSIGLFKIEESEALVLWDGANAGEFILSKKGYLGSTMAKISGYREYFNNLYFYYFLKMLEPTSKDFANGTTIPHFDASILINYHYPIPPIDEQIVIGSYLDAATSKIDKAIAMQQKMIDLLNERKQIIIQNAVTKGLDENVEMKDSGVEWIGMIPKHWKIIRIKHLAKLQSGSNLTSNEISDTGSYPVYGGNGLRGFYGSYNCEGSHVLIGRQGALCGNINYAEDKFWATEHAVVCYPKKKYNTLWFGEILRLMNLGQYSLASAQPGLAVERIKGLYMPYPSIEEQNKIALFLKQNIGKIDLYARHCQRQITLLQERKQIIINEVVTGKVKVS